jgi:hypothetical protein
LTTTTTSFTTTTSTRPSDEQVGGDHYKKYKIQPIEYAYANNMGALEHGVIKYVTRHRDKGKAEDIHKAIHYCKLILQFEYGENESSSSV